MERYALDLELIFYPQWILYLGFLLMHLGRGKKASVYRNITNEQGVFYINNIKNIVNGATLSAFDMSTNQPVSTGAHTRALGDVLVEYPEMFTAIGDKQVSTSARIYEATGIGLGGGTGSYNCLCNR